MLLRKMKFYLLITRKLFLKNVLTVLFIFLALSFFLNILGEIKFFQNHDVSIFFTIFLTLLNIPSIAFELFPFIFLIATQLFFMKLHDNGELIVLKNYGLSNLKIIIFKIYYNLNLYNAQNNRYSKNEKYV